MHAGAGGIRAGAERLGQAGLDDADARQSHGRGLEGGIGNGLGARGPGKAGARHRA
jgi:hypothetical protein